MTDIVDQPIQIDNPSSQREDVVRIAILIDESGSMLGAAMDTIKNVNSYLDEQGTTEKKTLVSLYTFEGSAGVKERFIGVNAKETPRMTVITGDDANLVYKPNGGTPLFDAIGTVVTKETRDDVPTLVVILTDGQENASREIRTLTDIQAVISQQEEKGWSFVWLMAGLSREASVNYTTSMMGRAYDGATMSYSKGMEEHAFRGLVSSSASWSNAVREVYTSGGNLNSQNVQNVTQDFFAEGTRDIKKEENK